MAGKMGYTTPGEGPNDNDEDDDAEMQPKVQAVKESKAPKPSFSTPKMTPTVTVRDEGNTHGTLPAARSHRLRREGKEPGH
jgi:hypothetical protein